MSTLLAMQNVDRSFEQEVMDDDLGQGLKEAVATGEAKHARITGADFTKDAVRASTQKAIEAIQKRRDERIDAMRAAHALEQEGYASEVARLNEQRSLALKMAEELSTQANTVLAAGVKARDESTAEITAELKTFNDLLNFQREMLSKL